MCGNPTTHLGAVEGRLPLDRPSGGGTTAEVVGVSLVDDSISRDHLGGFPGGWRRLFDRQWVASSGGLRYGCGPSIGRDLSLLSQWEFPLG